MMRTLDIPPIYDISSLDDIGFQMDVYKMANGLGLYVGEYHTKSDCYDIYSIDNIEDFDYTSDDLELVNRLRSLGISHFYFTERIHLSDKEVIRANDNQIAEALFNLLTKGSPDRWDSLYDIDYAIERCNRFLTNPEEFCETGDDEEFNEWVMRAVNFLEVAKSKGFNKVRF